MYKYIFIIIFFTLILIFMKRVLIKDALLSTKEVVVAGFVDAIRDKKNICFIVVRDISSKMQLTIDKLLYPHLSNIVSSISLGSVIEASGVIQKTDFVKLNGVEMLVENIKILSYALPSPIVSSQDTETNLNLRLNYRWLDLREEKNILMFQVQTSMVNACRRFLLERNFIEIHTPKLISTESESGAGVFHVDYFGRVAYLAQSPQFYKQMSMAAGFERVFEIGPVFRAEKSNSRKHATEFSGLDVEIAYISSFEEVMDLEQEMLVYALENIKTQYGDKIKELYGIDVIVPKCKFPVVKLSDLYIMLENLYGYSVDEKEKVDLTSDAERLCERLAKEQYDSEFLFVTYFPAEKRAFYHMRDENNIPCGYDLIWKGVEITTGAQREHRYEVLKRQAEEKGLCDNVKDYLEFFKYGCPPHGGFGIGIDRLTLILFNSTIKQSMFLFRGPDRIKP